MALNFFLMKEGEAKLARVMSEFGCETGTLHGLGAEGELQLLCALGVPEFLIEKISRIPFGKGIAGVAAESQSPVELCNLQADLGGVAKEDAKKSGVAGSLAVPIFSEDAKRVIGTLGIGKRVPYQFTEEEKRRLAAYGAEMRGLLAEVG